MNSKVGILSKLRSSRANEEGFTLIELMIVVVIIGILAAIAIPIFSNQQREAIRAAMKSDVKNLNTVVTTYLTTNPSATNLQWRLQNGVISDTLSALEGDANWRKLSTGISPSHPDTILIIRQGMYSNDIGTWDAYRVVAANPTVSLNSSHYYVFYSSLTGKITDANG